MNFIKANVSVVFIGDSTMRQKLWALECELLRENHRHRLIGKSDLQYPFRFLIFVSLQAICSEYYHAILNSLFSFTSSHEFLYTGYQSAQIALNALKVCLIRINNTL